MNIFLSYPSSHRNKVESVCYELQAEGHEVFFDKEDLSPGQGYNERIRSAIENCDLFIFMITPESVAKGKYTLTELKIAIRKWPNPASRVLPVMLEPTSFEAIPAYLKAVTVLSPEGNLTAEVAMEVADLASVKSVDYNKAEMEIELPRFSYLPLEIRFGKGSDGEYPISITDSPAGNLHPQPCAFDPNALKQLLQASTSHIGETVRRAQINQRETGVALQPSIIDAKKIGEQLYRLLFTSPIQTGLDDSLRSIDPQRGQGLRFLINTTEAPDLAGLPWEFLYSPKEDDFLFTDMMKPVVRWLDVKQPPPSLVVQPPLRLLIAIASPPDRPELSVGKEIAHLDDALRDLVDKGLVEIQRLEHATLEQLDSALLQNKPHVLHFIGHGDFSGNEGMIVLEAKTNDGAEPISGRRLGVLLRNHLGSLRFVFLNSCLGATISVKDPFGGVAQNLIQRGIPAVIAMQFPIPDRAAVSLARHFYRYLAAGLPVDAAITSTRAFLFAKGYDVEWGAPALYMRTPDGRLFDVDSAAAVDAPFVVPPSSQLPEPKDKSNDSVPRQLNLKWWLVLVLFLSLALFAGVLELFINSSPDKTIKPPEIKQIIAPKPDPAELVIAPKPDPAELAIEKTYRDALSSLEKGNTQVAIDKLRTAREKDPDLQFLIQNPSLRLKLIDAIVARANLELANGNLELAQSIVDQLMEIEPTMSQKLQKKVFNSIERANQIDNLSAQIRAALSKGELALAQKVVDQLLEIAPDNTQAREFQEEIKFKKFLALQLTNEAKGTNGNIKTRSLQPGQIHKVIPGDSLWVLADAVYGDPTQWPHIYSANRKTIANPDLIYPGQELILPIITDLDHFQFPQKLHRVKKDDSLWHIAGVVYGDPFRWPEIFEANRSSIKNPDYIFPNQQLIIPNDQTAKTN